MINGNTYDKDIRK